VTLGAGERRSGALRDQPFEVVDQRRHRSFDHVENLRVCAGRATTRVLQVLVAGHRIGIPSTQQLDLHRLDRCKRDSTGLHSATQPLEVVDNLAIHRHDEIEQAEVVRMYLPPDMVEVVTAQTTLVRGQRMRKVADVIASRPGRIEADVLCSATSGQLSRYRESGRRTTVIACRNEQEANRLRHRRGQALAENLRNRKLLVTTNTLENAMAALATTGDSSQAIANGMAATL
jgi:hypothetical protein